MDKITEEMCEFICDKRCMYANDNNLKQEELEDICTDCDLGHHVCNVLNKYNGNSAMDENLKTIAEHYGYENQSRQLVEEMAELMVALNKYARANNNKLDDMSVKQFLDIKHLEYNIHEELADVEVMLDQIKYLLNCNTLVQEIKEKKIARQLKRIAESEG